MNDAENSNSPFLFVIPTYRIEAACETARKYAENFRRFNHSIPIIIFDDSPNEDDYLKKLAVKYFSDLDQIYYVGFREKALFLSQLKKYFKNDALIDLIFRPSYGGNRNFTLAYTLGKKMITADDDMSPYGLFANPARLTNNDLVYKGRFVNDTKRILQIDQDIVGSFQNVLGKKAGSINYQKGEHLIDNSVDLLTNNTKKKLPNEIVLKLKKGKVPDNTVIKIAQTYRSGSPDVDAMDYINDFFENPEIISVNDLSQTLVVSYFKPCVTKLNWRFDPGVCALDNSSGLPPFIPTSLRFEDYIFRLWLQKDDVASAHVNAVQNHKRNPKRLSLTSSFLNEEIAAILKHVMRLNIKKINDTSIIFLDKFDVSINKIENIYQKGLELKRKAEKYLHEKPLYNSYFTNFLTDLEKTFFEFNHEAFISAVSAQLNDEYQLLLQTMDLWPKLLPVMLNITKTIRNLSYGGKNESTFDFNTIFAGQSKA
jgi:hypothetical protein